MMKIFQYNKLEDIYETLLSRKANSYPKPWRIMKKDLVVHSGRKKILVDKRAFLTLLALRTSKSKNLGFLNLTKYTYPFDNSDKP